MHPVAELVKFFIKNLILFLGLFWSLSIFLIAGGPAYLPPASNRVDFNFNYDWKFAKGNTPGASDATYDDSSWKGVSLPHTWNDDKFREWVFLTKTQAQDPLRSSGTYYGISWYRKHFTLDKIYADRKIILEFQGIGNIGTFFINGHAAGISESGVGPCGIDITPYVNFGSDNIVAVQVSNAANYHTIGYNGAILPFGQPFNPSFGGINRDVTLHITDKYYQTFPLYRNLGTEGTYIYPTNIDTLHQTADLVVQAEVENDYSSAKSGSFAAFVVDQDGHVVWTQMAPVQKIEAGAKYIFKLSGNLTGIHFWSPDYPYLYKVYTVLYVDKTVVDVETTVTGIRKFNFNSSRGLEVNGHPIYLKGYAPRCSMEWPCVGTPVDWLNEYDFKMMKENHANFVRPMHIAPRKVQVEAADKFGIVMVCPAANNEGDTLDPNIWQQRLDDMRDVTIYYRNNPSVLFYEGGNQSLSPQHMVEMKAIRLKWDPNGGRLAGTRSSDDDKSPDIREYSSSMDSVKDMTSTPLWDAEYGRGEAPRRVWDDVTPMLNPRWDGKDPASKYVTGGYFAIASDYHRALGLNSGVGDFIGEYLYPIYRPIGPPSYSYFRLQNSEDLALENLAKYYARYSRSAFVQSPGINSSKGVMVGAAKIFWADSVSDGRMHNTEVARVSGVVDGARLPKEVFFGLQVAQNPEPQVHILGHWNYPADTQKIVYVVSNTTQVDLQTYNPSGKLLTDYGHGAKNFFPTTIFPIGGDQINGYVFAFARVNWQPGSIRAIGYDAEHHKVATDEKKTAGAPVALRLTPTVSPSGHFMADGSDIAWFDAEVVDADGQRCPTYEDTVTFDCTGEGIFLGGYNSGIRYSTNLANHTSGYKLNLECGINRVFVRSTRKAGDFTLSVTGANLTSTSATITSEVVDNPGGLSTLWPPQYTFALGAEPAPSAEHRGVQRKAGP